MRHEKVLHYYERVMMPIKLRCKKSEIKNMYESFDV